MAAVGAVQRAAGPEQGVGMEIDDVQPSVVAGGLLGRFERPDIDHAVDLAFEDAGQGGQRRDDGDDEHRA